MGLQKERTAPVCRNFSTKSSKITSEIQSCIDVKKGKRIKNAKGQALILPEEVIHHIQSFLSGKEAARSAILSKSWYASWLTCPTIDLDEEDFDYGDGGRREFGRFAKKTMQRYQTLNLKIESFRLRSYGSERSDRELIANAIKIGATHLQLAVNSLPQEVLRSETTLQLSLNNCYFLENRNYVISCSSLKSLTIANVNFCGGNVFKYITSCCISIKELSLSDLRGIRLEQSIELHKLQRLFLCAVKVHALFFTNFASRFPCLKDLTLHDCCVCNNRICIATTSLQTISFEPKSGSDSAKFDVPNIRKFTYSGRSLPPYLSIDGASSWEWELDISIACYDLQKTSWFMNLKNLLNNFRRSKIFLFIDLCAYQKDRTVDVEVMPKPLVVENLTIAARPTLCCALLRRSFGVFRPKFVTFCDSRNSYTCKHKVKAIDIFHKRLIQALLVSNCQEKFERFGLKKLNVQICEEFDTEWRTLKLKKALAGSEAKVRLQLIWDD